jgi:nucleoside-diphosphate-sugar epimerase
MKSPPSLQLLYSSFVKGNLHLTTSTTAEMIKLMENTFRDVNIALDGPEVVVWGTGKSLRKFMHVDDMASACVYLMENYDYYDIRESVNIGVGEDVTISELVKLI